MNIAFFLVVLIAWEALYFAGLIDPDYHYHPVGALQILLDISFLRGFGIMSLQLIVASLVGGAIAGAIGSLILRSTGLVGSTIRFLRIGMWIPFIIYWPLPAWDPWVVNFGLTFVLISLVSVTAVALSGIQCFLVSRFVLNLQREDTRWWLLRTAMLQALLISVCSQPWLGRYGWRWFDFGVGGAYAASMVVLLLMFVIERSIHTRFDYVSTIRGNILTREFECFTGSTLFGSFSIALALLLVWQVISLSSLQMVFSSPLKVLGACYYLLSEKMFWRDFYLSMSVVFGSLIVGVTTSLILYRVLDTYDYLREQIIPLLPFLHITLVFSPVILMWWLGEVGFWQKSLGIGLVNIYPMIEALWGLRGRSPGLRLLLGIDNALPYAVVMMLFSEAMASKGGLGFSIMRARTSSHTVPEGIAVALLIIVLLLALSSTLRVSANRLDFSGDLQG